MSLQILHQHWALLVSGAIALVVLLWILLRLVRNSARARLAVAVGELRRKEKIARRARRRGIRASRCLEKLESKGQSAIPRRVEEAAGRLQDARALQKIADDQVLIARTQVRRIIFEEYPPRRHEVLRRRLLPEQEESDKPFTMGS